MNNIREGEKLAYAAGFIDGEGCFHWSKRKQFQIRVVNGKLKPLKFLRDLFGGKIYRRKKIITKSGYRKQYYEWYLGGRLGGREATDAANRLKPYLLVKSVKQNDPLPDRPYW